MKQRLALNMIVGAGDGPVLNRLMSSYDMKSLFDEIVIVRTTDDQEVISVINQYADKTTKFEWNTEDFPKGNFGGARDAARLLTNSEWIMWLDSDDMLASEEDIEKIFNRIKSILVAHSDRDYFVCPYILGISDKGEPTNVISRERIFKRQSTIQWIKPIHEQLTINTEIHKRADLNGLDILHCPVKTGEQSAIRNIEILENEYLKSNKERHDAFYYGRDLIQLDRWENAVSILVDFIETANEDLSCVYDASLLIAKFFMYKQLPDKKQTSLCETTSPIAEQYARICLSITESNAEPYTVLGDVYISQRRNRDAIRMFKQAMTKQFGTGSLQDRSFYEEMPARRLAELFVWENELEQAIWYNKVAMKHCPEDKNLIEQRKKIITKLQETV